MTLIEIKYKNNKQAKCLLLPMKERQGWSFINLTKGHICPCIFPSREEALNDLNNYSTIKEYSIKELLNYDSNG